MNTLDWFELNEEQLSLRLREQTPTEAERFEVIKRGKRLLYNLESLLGSFPSTPSLKKTETKAAMQKIKYVINQLIEDGKH